MTIGHSFADGGLSTKVSKKSLYNQVRSMPNLRAAWGVVNSKALKSPSTRIRQEAIEFSREADKHLYRIQRQLGRETFKFLPSRGIVVEKSPGKKRPLVIAPLESRIVQRAFLQVIQKVPELKPLFEIPTSCGGIKERGVSYAIDLAYKKITSDGEYFFRSDIKSFFTKIPRPVVVSEVRRCIDDHKFLDLFINAIETVVSNNYELGSDRDLFPLDDIGVAQGSCLSPLMGNIVLHEFDRVVNSKDVLCLRYIDDFIVIGPNKKAVQNRLSKGLKVLDKLGLDFYIPGMDKDKAESGNTGKGFAFLGCSIRPGLITPVKKSRNRLLAKVDEIISESVENLKRADYSKPIEDFDILSTLDLLDHTISAWGNQYQFCNDYSALRDMDVKISQSLKRYLAFYSTTLSRISPGEFKARRRLLGVHLLLDSKKNPLIK